MLLTACVNETVSGGRVNGVCEGKTYFVHFVKACFCYSCGKCLDLLKETEQTEDPDAQMTSKPGKVNQNKCTINTSLC